MPQAAQFSQSSPPGSSQVPDWLSDWRVVLPSSVGLAVGRSFLVSGDTFVSMSLQDVVAVPIETPMTMA